MEPDYRQRARERVKEEKGFYGHGKDWEQRRIKKYEDIYHEDEQSDRH